MVGHRVSFAGGTSRGVVLDLIRTRGPISRVALAELTGLTQATMSTVVRQLLDEGLILETGRGESTGGKPPVMVDIDPNSRFAVGVQLGRESITYVAIDLSGAIVGRTRTPGVGSTEPAEMVGRLAAEIDRTLAGLDIAKRSVLGVGVVAPGPLDLAQGAILRSPHLSAWSTVPLRDLLSTALGLPVLLDNDATAAAIGDFWNGRLDGVTAHATVYMGTGIGAGILIDGIVFRGARSNAGELGQVVVAVDHAEPVFLEDVAAPSAVVERARSTTTGARWGLTGLDEFDDFRRVALAAAHGDAEAGALIEFSAGHLAAGVLTLANLFDLDSITLAGPGFGVAGPTYVTAISRRLETDLFARMRHGVRVRLSPDVANAAAIGGAALVMQHELAPRTMGLSSLVAR